MKKSLIGALLISYLPFAQATTFDKLLTVSNDRTAVTNELDLVLDAHGMISGIAWLTNDAGKIAEKDFLVTALASHDGAVLEEQQGVKALQLMGHIDAAAGTGALVVHYVNNGLSGVYKDCNVNVARTTAGDWMMLNAYNGKPVSTAKILTSTFGITTIEGICP